MIHWSHPWSDCAVVILIQYYPTNVFSISPYCSIIICAWCLHVVSITSFTLHCIIPTHLITCHYLPPVMCHLASFVRLSFYTTSNEEPGLGRNIRVPWGHLCNGFGQWSFVIDSNTWKIVLILKMAFAAECYTVKGSHSLPCCVIMGMPFHMTLVSHYECSATRVWISPFLCSPCAASFKELSHASLCCINNACDAQAFHRNLCTNKTPQYNTDYDAI